MGLPRRLIERFEPGGAWQTRGLLLYVLPLPVLFGFVLPVTVLVIGAWTVGDPMVGRSFSSYVGNTVGVAAVAAVAATACALWLCYAVRVRPTPLMRFGLRTATLGYALPGTITSDSAVTSMARRATS